MRKVYAVVGYVTYENEDVLGIYSSKVAAIKAATKVAQRPIDYYADYINYDSVSVYCTSLNKAINNLRADGAEVWNDDGIVREYKAKAS